jgi:hypothetical protein
MLFDGCSPLPWVRRFSPSALSTGWNGAMSIQLYDGMPASPGPRPGPEPGAPGFIPRWKAAGCCPPITTAAARTSGSSRKQIAVQQWCCCQRNSAQPGAGTKPFVAWRSLGRNGCLLTHPCGWVRPALRDAADGAQPAGLASAAGVQQHPTGLVFPLSACPGKQVLVVEPFDNARQTNAAIGRGRSGRPKSMARSFPLPASASHLGASS